ncbi:MAG TPA: phosphoribosylamine--glycine ligase [Candidatus Angelobacter sp.]|nr:phosphoribosylamine--glycine ligase [Candidatus Angelobacter sp.]
MKILVIGNGGREHALAWKLRQSPRVSEVLCVPGNGGICAEATCLPGEARNIESLLAVAHQQQPDITLVGPELPLSLGIVDEFSRRGLRIFGPKQAAAQLESSKSFAKEFMQRHQIPTAHYAVCSSEDELRKSLGLFSTPIVVKADGLAAGKGVVIAASKEEAATAGAEMFSGKLLGSPAAKVVLEECLQGEELSFLVVSDGERVAPLVVSQDHKRVGDGDTGPNTGGMGAYSADSLIDPAMVEWLLNRVAKPTIAGMKSEGAEYRGVLYCGLMMTARGPMVLEFNCRFGDPETQAVLMRMDSDLVEAVEASIEGRVSEGVFHWSADASCCVVIASGGYPGSFLSGKLISGLDGVAELPNVKVFHAGTTQRDGEFYTNGGRVLGVTARAPKLEDAVARAYEAVGIIKFQDMYFRKDIGARVMGKSAPGPQQQAGQAS